nr:helix-turn-helix transcriptional regulator [Microbulbifer rhizosphaerae]
MQLGEAMKLARLEQRLSQSAVARSLGIQQSYLSKVENDTATPSVTVLQKLCSAYGVKTHRLLRQLDREVLRRNGAYRAHLQKTLRQRRATRAGLASVLVAAVSLSALLLGRETASIHRPVTLVLDEVDGVEAIDLFAAYGQLEVRGRHLVAGKSVSIEVREIPWDQAFSELAKRLGVRAEFSGAIVELSPDAN